MGAQFGPIRAFTINGSPDPAIEKIDIKPEKETTKVITAGYADYMTQSGPKSVTITLTVQYPRGGGTIPYYTWFNDDTSFSCAWVDWDGVKGAAENCRVTDAPRSSSQVGAEKRSQSVTIVGFLVSL